MVSGRRPGESLIDASVRLLGFNLWATPPRETVHRGEDSRDRAISLSQLRRLTGYSLTTIRNRLGEAGLAPRIVGRTWLYPRAAALRVLEAETPAGLG